MTAPLKDLRARLDALTRGDPNLSAQFIETIAPIVWRTCTVSTINGAEAREAFLEMMRKLSVDNFALVRAYDEHGSFDRFVTLRCRDLAADRVLNLLRTDRQKGWRAFEALFQADLLRIIGRRLLRAANEDSRREAYQAICLALVEGDCRRLIAYRGQGSFAGFVLRMADRLLIDHLRTLNAQRRITDVLAAMAMIDGEAVEVSPEIRHAWAEEDAFLAAAADVLARAAQILPEAERLYLAIVLAHGQTPPAREVARLMQRPVEEIYKMKQRILKRLRDLIAEDAAVKNWRASV